MLIIDNSVKKTFCFDDLVPGDVFSVAVDMDSIFVKVEARSLIDGAANAVNLRTNKIASIDSNEEIYYYPEAHLVLYQD